MSGQASARAQALDLDPEPPELRLSAGLEASGGVIAEDLYAQLALKMVASKALPALGADRLTELRAELVLPLRLRVYDRPPLDPSGAVLRPEDWDESGDLLRVLRRVRYGDASTPVEVALGALAGEQLGHGTMLYGYYNVISPDYVKVGALARADLESLHVYAMVDDARQPSLSAARLAWPLTAQLTLGASAMADWRAPTALALAPDGSLVVGLGQRPQVWQTRRAFWLGADAAWWWGPLMLYADLNWHVQTGAGAHGGLALDLELGPVVTRARLELTLSFEGYIPRYVGPLYELERLQSLGYGLTRPLPRLRQAAQLKQQARPGWFGQLDAQVTPWRARLTLSGAQQGQDTSTAWLFGAVQANPTRALWLASTLAHHGGWAIRSSGRALWLNELRYDLGPWLYAHASYNRLWRLDAAGRFKAVPEAFVGFGASLAME